MLNKLFFLLLLVTSCMHSKDYYQSDDYKIKQRQKDSYKMYKKTQEVREKCSPKFKRPKNRRRKHYYS